jgi:hypothetical protein
MMFLTLDPKFKNLGLVSSFIGLEQGKVIVKEYDKKNLVSHVVQMLSSITPLV